MIANIPDNFGQCNLFGQLFSRVLFFPPILHVYKNIMRNKIFKKTA